MAELSKLQTIEQIRELMQKKAEEAQARFGEQEETVTDDRDRRFRFIPAYEIISKFTHISWIIKGYLEKNTMAMIVAEPGSWKTFVVLSMAYCVAAGLSWFGNAVKTPGAVFIVCGEGFSGMARRLRALELHHGIPIKDIPLFISNCAAAFTDDNGAEIVVQAVEELKEIHGEPVLIVVDTLSRNFGHADENSTKDMSLFISQVDTALRARFEAAVMIIHHVGLNAKDRGRGSGALRGALEFEYLVTKNPNGTRTMRTTKVKDFEAPPSLTFRSEEIELPGWYDEDTGELLTSLVMIRTEDDGNAGQKENGKSLTGQAKIGMDILREALAEKGITPPEDIATEILKHQAIWPDTKIIHEDDWRDACYKKGLCEAAAADGTKRKAFWNVRKSLANKEVIRCFDGWFWIVCKN